MRPSLREKAVLVALDLKTKKSHPVSSEFSAEDSLEELHTLAVSAGAQIQDKILQSRGSVDAATLLGSGKVEELRAIVKATEADLVIFDQELTPSQQRNLDRILETRVIDRTQLILDIFASRARTREGQLQVELAQLNYILPRLSGQGISMSRMGGGIGARGPGETKLETDRRRIRTRISKIGKEIDAVRGSRSIQRRQRQSVPLATIALVGYTNAGKSTLFNRLTRSAVDADARMFATLDPTVRSLELPSKRNVLLSDTVGFIRQLPTTLVKAFRATLEEVCEASVLLHVFDCSHPHWQEHSRHVEAVLEEIGAKDTPRLLVANKVDLQSNTNLPEGATGISAATGFGIDRLLIAIDNALLLDPLEICHFRIPSADGAALNLLHSGAKVIKKKLEDEDVLIEAQASASLRKRLKGYIDRAE